MKMVMWFRYRVTVKGLENLDSHKLPRSGGVLFLPNHPTVFADPVLITLAIHKKFPIRPMIVEYMYYLPVVNRIMRLMDALPVPNFVTSSNSLKKKKADQVFETVIEGLNKGDNFLIYPGGKVKHSSHEAVSGSGIPYIIQAAPNANIVLVRIKGLWGSSFSRALTGKTPYMFATIFQGIKNSLKNLIFFNPRREIIIELEPIGPDFPLQGSRHEINKYLENWYNKPDGLTPTVDPEQGDSLCLVPYSIWNNELPVITAQEAEELPFDLKTIPLAVQNKVKQKLSEITEISSDQIRTEQNLSADLGLDSLDTAEISAFLDDEFGVTGVQVNDITTVAKVMALASGQITVSENVEDETVNLSKWARTPSKERLIIPEGETIPEVFLRTCEKMGSIPACGDNRSGVLTYSQLKMRVILLAEYIRKLPGENIGILLPSSVVAYMTILAVQTAGKTPVMINWTVGPRHLDSVKQLSNIQTILSSWAFLDRLENIQFNGLEEMMILLEDLRFKISLLDKVKAFFRSKMGIKNILKHFNIDKKSGKDPAVFLFTSGTENLPKGVPLSHHNILSNQRASVQGFEVFSDDVLLGILPPFHAFGFTVSGLLPILAGCRAAYYPNPTDGAGVARALAQWQATIVCGAPTFLKGMLKAAKSDQLKTLRMLVSGAEQAPPDLRDLARQFQAQLVEGYGITECSPVLTMNDSGNPEKGVGTPLKDIQVQVVDLITHSPLPSGEQGLVVAKGPNIFKGYLNKEVASPFITVENQAWYSTGDLGYIDNEGNLILSGRLKRFVKIAGEMVSLSAIENALQHSLNDKIKQSAPEEGPALAICAKEEAGEKTRLFLFTAFNLAADEANKALRDSGFSNLIRISQVQFLPTIPIMGTGKVNYRELETKI